ncbi:MAG: cobalamin biosynthesis protein CbiA [Pseudomonadota bacterium]
MSCANIDIKGIVIICGNYGSGKTETAIHLAVKRRMEGIQVKIADLDLVNPYFRTREAKVFLESMGIEVILPDKRYHYADLPILAPGIAGMIKQPSELTILDAGGNDVGVVVLAALENHLKKQKVQMLQVINPFRPYTQDVNGCIKIKDEIEYSSKMKVTGIVGNSNLMDETTPDHIYSGYSLLKQVSNVTELKIEFITADSRLLPQLDLDRFDCPILKIDRKLNFPWKKR